MKSPRIAGLAVVLVLMIAVGDGRCRAFDDPQAEGRSAEAAKAASAQSAPAPPAAMSIDQVKELVSSWGQLLQTYAGRDLNQPPIVREMEMLTNIFAEVAQTPEGKYPVDDVRRVTLSMHDRVMAGVFKNQKARVVKEIVEEIKSKLSGPIDIQALNDRVRSKLATPLETPTDAQVLETLTAVLVNHADLFDRDWWSAQVSAPKSYALPMPTSHVADDSAPPSSTTLTDPRAKQQPAANNNTPAERNSVPESGRPFAEPQNGAAVRDYRFIEPGRPSRPVPRTGLGVARAARGARPAAGLATAAAAIAGNTGFTRGGHGDAPAAGIAGVVAPLAARAITRSVVREIVRPKPLMRRPTRRLRRRLR